MLLSEDSYDKSCSYYKKLHNVIDNRGVELTLIKKSLYKNNDGESIISKLVGNDVYLTNTSEVLYMLP